MQINPLTAHMAEMGFPLHWCERALAETGDDIEAALNWILSNGELLTVEDSLRESIQAQSEAVVEVAAAEMARAEAAEAAAAAAAAAAAEAEEAAAAAAAESSSRSGRAGGEEDVEDGETQERNEREQGDARREGTGDSGDGEGTSQAWTTEDGQGQQVMIRFASHGGMVRARSRRDASAV